MSPQNSGTVGDQAIEQFKSKERAETALVPKMFMSRPDVAELAERLRMMVVGGERAYTPLQALTLAQAALAHGLSPFNGEIYLMVDKQTGESRGMVIGVKGIRKHARRQARRMGTSYDIQFEHVTDPEVLALQAPKEFYSDRAIVVKATLTVASHVDKWLEQMWKIYKLTSMNTKEAIEILGPKPEIVVFGVYDPVNENYAAQKSKNKTSMSPVSKAKKRAEANALKEGFDLPFGLEYDPAADEVFGADVHDYGEDEFDEGQMTMDVDEDEEEWLATKAKVSEEDEIPSTQEGKISQLGFK